MSFRAKAAMFGVMNVFMSVAMSFTADIKNGSVSARTLLMIAVGFIVGMVLSFIIPFGKISAMSCRAFGIDGNRIAGNLVGNIVPAFINIVIIGAVMTAVNVSPFKLGMKIYIEAFFSVFPIQLIVGYIVACIANPISLSVGKAIQKRCRKGKEGDDPK